ncbi:amino acid:proton antiporter [Reticulibacter mediterranei]|uniref:Amino acid:proton antiporter n=1 Tax=Reticulibacter mediterranei TaxID=2778369 RepID=A0A8J3IPW4_9CHLR|nr:APC family permease [Reticulibacter mediterranei]GHO98576.1 amino acid:proton antiporter [Reticulibacter mediterranei]
MATTTTESSKGEVLRSERIAGGILSKVLNTFDLVAIFIAIVLFITNAPGIAAAGPVAYIYLVAGFLTFLIPGAIVVGQLGRMFPQEGSIYVWTNKAFGPFWGFFAGFCAWWPGIFVVMVCGSLVSTFISQLAGLFGLTILAEPWQLGLVILAVTAISFWLSAIRFRAAQNLVNIMFVLYGAAIVLIGIAGVAWLLSGHPGFTNMAVSGGGWAITFGSTGNFTIFGFVILALLGIEVPLNMGVEVTSERAVTCYLVWGTIVVMVAYLLTTFGIMTAVPSACPQVTATCLSSYVNTNPQTNLWAMVDAVHNGFGPAGLVLSVIVDLIMIGFGLYAALIYNYSFGRMLFVSGLDRRLPAAMSKVNAARVPWVAVLVQSIIIVVLAIAVYMVIPYTAASNTTNRANLVNLMYYILFVSIAVIWCISMIFQFIDIIVIRYKYHEEFADVRLAPDWVFYLCSIVGMLASGIGLYATVSAPGFPT